jgi:hypothetical protein
MRVFYEDWQMECCGTPFAVGDEVAWPLVAYDAGDIRQGWGYGAGARVERHGGGPDEETAVRLRATGRVHAIELVRQEFVVHHEAVPGAHTLEAVGTCPKWFEKEEPGSGPGPRRIRRAVGVLVTLDVPDVTWNVPDVTSKVPDGTPPQPGDHR